MKKKYRLEIPEMINKNLSPLTAETWLKYDGKVLSENQYKCALADGISDWLEEIKQPEILTDQELLKTLKDDDLIWEDLSLLEKEAVVLFQKRVERNTQLRFWHEGGGVVELVEAVEGALKISDLWRPNAADFKEVEECYDGEIKALETMHSKLKQALEKIQKPE